MLKFDFDDSALDAAIDRLANKVRNEVIISGAAAAAVEFYVEAKLRAPVSDAPHMFHGTHAVYGPFNPGNLRDAIYRVYSNESKQDKAVYHIAWNHKKAPYGFMVEFGTSHTPARPFLRPAYDAAKSAAVSASMDAMRRKLNV